ncbi:MAG: hypothetical protein JST43_09755 [Bacteroidetes bacterium]|nr:hypothetical protein [Bacteroidota bacterium]
MKRIYLFIPLIFLLTNLKAQDEGSIVKRERIKRDKSIFIGGGISKAGSLDDYSLGVNFEGGYTKRLNRILSIGGSFSYLKFTYDQKISSSGQINPTNINTYPSNFYYSPASLSTPGYYDVGALISVSGSNLSVISLAANIKLNFVPIMESTKISVYGFAKPFIAKGTSSSGQIIVDGVAYNSSTGGLDKVPSSTQSVPFDQESVTTGGIFIGPGLELFPNNPISFFMQASFGYTFPIDQSSIKSLSKDISQWPAQPPVKSVGFTSINLAAGISFNLD